MSRRGTAQAGFPEDRGAWLAAAVALTVLLAWVVINRGPYGGAISAAGAVLRTFVLVLLALIPIVALVWAWRRLSRRSQAIAPIPVGVLTVLLLLLAVAHSAIYLERMRMSQDPARMAEAEFARGDRRLMAVNDSLNALHVPPVLNRCIINRYDTRIIPGTDGMTVNRAHARYRETAARRAEQYNAVLIQRLRIPAAEVQRFSDGSNCPD
ncbi:hypothetical protein [Longimicrobium sp.]|uniref:hypothetical protein n=1 Tax=Longimicrobium sp. TaxID=2029185 RepID=UPI002E3319F0|nr:hypothetical protein [Longimicrobium sp.]HEX6042116.1 hypothetical protein [Longimicrobium sp.]